MANTLHAHQLSCLHISNQQVILYIRAAEALRKLALRQQVQSTRSSYFHMKQERSEFTSHLLAQNRRIRELMGCHLLEFTVFTTAGNMLFRTSGKVLATVNKEAMKSYFWNHLLHCRYETPYFFVTSGVPFAQRAIQHFYCYICT
jgi:hypothetical protein